ncbi:MAG: transglycosylase SLT domain-containing protein, partial [Paracoccaceae bacterium]
QITALTLSACLLPGAAHAQKPTLVSFNPGVMPAMRWDAKAGAAAWTATAMAAVAKHDGELAGRVPRDVAAFCPDYAKGSLQDRRAFWVGLMSATAKHESGFNAKASGGGGRYVGLMQISPATARTARCGADSTVELKDGAANLECAVKVMAPHVAADGVVAGKGGAGVGRDWGPFSNPTLRRDIAAWTSVQDYCRI